jgi:hypothetical protein
MNGQKLLGNAAIAQKEGSQLENEEKTEGKKRLMSYSAHKCVYSRIYIIKRKYVYVDTCIKGAGEGALSRLDS